LGGVTHGEPAYNDYDRFAQVYTRYNQASPFLALYERPATLSLVGDVRGRRVLDAGCGAGAQAVELVRRGALVTGVDLSRGLLGIARGRLGPHLSLHRGLGGRRPQMRMRFWHRPLRAMLAAFTSSGFVVDEIVEPEPLPEMAEAAPDTYQRLSRDAQFLVFSLIAR
jgi:SAM-dependent methyltransferase